MMSCAVYVPDINEMQITGMMCACADICVLISFVLMEQRGNAAARSSIGNESAWEGESVSSGAHGQWRDHVNELGLPNDGYDYGKHLKSIGMYIRSIEWRRHKH